MKNSESIILVVAIIIIISLIGFIVFSLSSSSKSIRINSYENQNNNNTNSEPIVTQNNNNNYSKTNEMKTEIKETEEKLSSFSSDIYDNDTNRMDNIALAISKINEKIINPGEIFSFNETVGPMDLEHGFKESTVFDADGNITKAPGGGMCQISSTMYCACLDGGLEIVERHPHSRRVDYVPPDRDATIYYNTLDFKFKNNTESKIKIIATSDEYNVTIVLNKIVSKSVSVKNED